MNRETRASVRSESAVSGAGKSLRLVKRLNVERGTSCGSLPLVRQQRLILASRDVAFRMARRMLRAWSAPLERDETQSLVDLALVKAARCFRPEEGCRFTSYLYFFLHGELTRAVSRAVRDTGTLSLEHLHQSRRRVPEIDRESEEVSSQFPQESSLSEGSHSPEHEVYLAEIRLHCRNALARLTHFERRVVEAVHINGLQVTAAARRLGFSRGHVSKTRTDALRKLRPDLEAFRPAA